MIGGLGQLHVWLKECIFVGKFFKFEIMEILDGSDGLGGVDVSETSLILTPEDLGNCPPVYLQGRVLGMFGTDVKVRREGGGVVIEPGSVGRSEVVSVVRDALLKGGTGDEPRRVGGGISRRAMNVLGTDVHC